mgnify:CR=1 FL=1
MTGLVPRDPLSLLLAVLAIVALTSLVLALVTDLIRWAGSLSLLVGVLV